MNCEGFDLEHQINYMYEYIQDVLLQKQAIKLRQKFDPNNPNGDGLDPEI